MVMVWGGASFWDRSQRVCGENWRLGTFSKTSFYVGITYDRRREETKKSCGFCWLLTKDPSRASSRRWVLRKDMYGWSSLGRSVRFRMRCLMLTLDGRGGDCRPETERWPRRLELELEASRHGDFCSLLPRPSPSCWLAASRQRQLSRCRHRLTLSSREIES